MKNNRFDTIFSEKIIVHCTIALSILFMKIDTIYHYKIRFYKEYFRSIVR